MTFRFGIRTLRLPLRHSLRSQRGGSARALGLLAVMILTACTPAASPTILPADLSATDTPPATPLPGTATLATSPTETPSEIPVALATSRGPELEATDPTIISLTSGELHFVEFFRFT